jgi:hypothetical protein
MDMKHTAVRLLLKFECSAKAKTAEVVNTVPINAHHEADILSTPV